MAYTIDEKLARLRRRRLGLETADEKMEYKVKEISSRFRTSVKEIGSRLLKIKASKETRSDIDLFVKTLEHMGAKVLNERMFMGELRVTMHVPEAVMKINDGPTPSFTIRKSFANKGYEYFKRKPIPDIDLVYCEYYRKGTSEIYIFCKRNGTLSIGGAV